MIGGVTNADGLLAETSVPSSCAITVPSAVVAITGRDNWVNCSVNLHKLPPSLARLLAGFSVTEVVRPLYPPGRRIRSSGMFGGSPPPGADATKQRDERGVELDGNCVADYLCTV
jgi:hypothetical protein